MPNINNINFKKKTKVRARARRSALGLAGVMVGIASFSWLTYIPNQASAVYSDDGTSISTPLYKSLSDITYMQEMTAEICQSSHLEESKQLVDRRDNKSYWVTKLADGNCWMTQNLDLDLEAGQTLTSELTDIAKNNDGTNGNWIVPDTANIVPEGKPATDWIEDSDDLEKYSRVQTWDPGTVVYTSSNYLRANCNNVMNGNLSPTLNYPTSGGLMTPISNYDVCSTVGIFSRVDANMTYETHYSVGNLYSWNAAIAGSGAADGILLGDSPRPYESNDRVDAPSSICPKGFILPKSSRTSEQVLGWKTSFNRLFYSYFDITANDSWNSDKALIATKFFRLDPLYGVPAGYINSFGIGAAGWGGYYWSSTTGIVQSDCRSGFCANYLGFYGTGSTSSNQDFRSVGRSVRCVSNPDIHSDASDLVSDNPTIAVQVKPMLTMSLSTNNIAITADPNKITTGDFTATVSSSQAYSLSLSGTQNSAGKDESVDLTINNSNQNTQTIPAISSDIADTVTVGKNGWGIRTCPNNTLNCTTTDLNSVYTGLKTFSDAGNKVFYVNNTGVVGNETLFEVGVGISPTLPSGVYSTTMVVTATNN